MIYYIVITIYKFFNMCEINVVYGVETFPSFAHYYSDSTEEVVTHSNLSVIMWFLKSNKYEKKNLYIFT